MFVNRTHGVVAATLGALALGACTDPAQNTDLRPEGPPEVLSVLVMNDAAGMLNESATYCKPNDEKRPSLVGATQVCPATLSEGADEVTNAYPDGWYVRIMFDELLDPNIETLTEVIDESTGEGTDTYTGSIADTHPVKLECESMSGAMVNVDYDGYYSPSGNRVTFPLGPSLVIKPNDPTLIATSSKCQVTINDNVTDKTGNPVPADQRGPYKFQVAPIQVVLIDPSDGATIPASQVWVDNMYVQFNTTVDETSFCDDGPGMDECEFTFSPDIGECSTSGAPCDVAKSGSDCPQAAETCASGGFYAYSLAPYGLTDHEFGFGPNTPVQVEKDYKFSFVQGGKIKDRCGRETTFGAPSVDDQTEINYTTDKFKLSTTSIQDGETASGMKKLTVNTTNVLDLTSLDASEFSLTPAPLNGALTQLAGNDITFAGFFKINTEYTFTLNAGATLKDYWGVEYTNPTAKTIKWKTQPAITATFSPADNSRVGKSSATSLVGVTLTFNTAIKTTDLAAPATRTTTELTEGTEYTVTDSNGTAVTGFTIDTSSNTGCAEAGTSCAIRIRKALAPGNYTFTLKAGATLTDQTGDTYTQAADKVIHFTVYDNPPTPIQCL
jgi:hypothetical protein